MLGLSRFVIRFGMDEQASQPQFVNCPCQYCSGNIEFDANQFDPSANTTVPCPHCGLETIIFIPPVITRPKEVNPSATQPRFVCCNCRWCSGQIEFDANLLGNEKQIAGTCPHCGIETKMYEVKPLGCNPFNLLGYFVANLIMGLGSAGDHSSVKKLYVPAAPKPPPLPPPEETEVERELKKRRQAISTAVRREVWRRDEGKCVKCGSRERLEFDHIIPVAKGGSNTARNIELLCEACNRAKSDLIH